MSNHVWHPRADRSVPHRPKPASLDTRWPPRGVLHTTETSGLPSYRAPSAPPHFTVGRDGHIWQHFPVTETSDALRNVHAQHPDAKHDTGIDPDRTGRLNVQIEVIGRAASTTWPEAQVNAVADIMLWLESWGIPAEFRAPFGSSEQYGYRNPLELSRTEWENLNGWVGHQHVPENTHWDPGRWLPRYVEAKIKEIKAKQEEELERIPMPRWAAGSIERLVKHGYFPAGVRQTETEDMWRTFVMFDRVDSTLRKMIIAGGTTAAAVIGEIVYRLTSG